MMRKLLLFFAILTVSNLISQEEDLAAKSFLGKKAPEFVVGKWISEAPDINGKFMLIDFWATWCGPCRESIPKLNQLHRKFKDDLVIIGLSDESRRRIKRMKKPKIEYYSANDTRQRLERAYEVQAIPQSVIVDPNGYVVWEGHPIHITDEVIRKLIKAKR